MGGSKSSSKREVYSNTVLPKETRKNRIDNLTLHLKQLEKEEQKTIRISRRKEITKIREEISEKKLKKQWVELSAVTQSCLTLCDPMNLSSPSLPVHHKLLEFTQTHVHQVGDAIQPSHPLSSTSPPAPNPSQHQGLFQWVNSLHEEAKVLEFQLQHQSFQWTPRTDLL